MEYCTLDPQKSCNYITTLVPYLTPLTKCNDVPSEICSKSKTNPRKVKKPILKTWCYEYDTTPTPTTPDATTPTMPNEHDTTPTPTTPDATTPTEPDETTTCDPWPVSRFLRGLNGNTINYC